MTTGKVSTNLDVQKTGDSSDGRAVDCRSTGRVFNSLSPESIYKVKTFFRTLCGAVEERVAHNHKVGRSKLLTANILILSFWLIYSKT